MEHLPLLRVFFYLQYLSRPPAKVHKPIHKRANKPKVSGSVKALCSFVYAENIYNQPFHSYPSNPHCLVRYTWPHFKGSFDFFVLYNLEFLKMSIFSPVPFNFFFHPILAPPYLFQFFSLKVAAEPERRSLRIRRNSFESADGSESSRDSCRSSR